MQNTPCLIQNTVYKQHISKYICNENDYEFSYIQNNYMQVVQIFFFQITTNQLLKYLSQKQILPLTLKNIVVQQNQKFIKYRVGKNNAQSKQFKRYIHTVKQITSIHQPCSFYILRVLLQLTKIQLISQRQLNVSFRNLQDNYYTIYKMIIQKHSMMDVYNSQHTNLHIFCKYQSLLELQIQHFFFHL
eukprot:TRINITY_DN2029_c0_g2_i3.p2 TRINITY_DN2029_c0_g2~~TRINITY_DN2029_c0_g2_i3.p2  ORF type:complete len:188 (-),score=-21.16 TRINITY_DN2029_c0_g2_i3:314-877(-)